MKTEFLRTVHPTGPGWSAISNPTAIFSINTSRSRPLQPGWTVRLTNRGRSSVHLDTPHRKTKFLRPFQFLRADRPPPRTGRSSVHFGPPTEPKTVLFEHIRDNCGPSTPRSGPSAGLFPAEIYLGKTAITLSSNVQIW